MSRNTELAIGRCSSCGKKTGLLDYLCPDCWIKPVDIKVSDHGSLVTFEPKTDAGREWIDENIGPENGYQPQYPTVIAEPRYAGDILGGLREAGLEVSC